MPVKIQIFTEYNVSVILHYYYGEHYGAGALVAKKLLQGDSRMGGNRI